MGATNRNNTKIFFFLIIIVANCSLPSTSMPNIKSPSFPRFLLSLSLSLKPSPPLSLSSTGLFESNSASQRSMSGGVRSSPGPSHQPPPPPSSSAASVPVVPPISRHLAFASTKPPFHPSDNYHRFTPSHLTNNLVNGCGGLVDREEDAVVLRSPVSSPRVFRFWI